MSSKIEKYEIPEILYEEPQPGIAPNRIPYIEVPKEKQMPPVLFIFEYKHTGETEPGPNGDPMAIVDQVPHKYVDMELLKEKLSPETNDEVRVALGLKPLLEAQKKGKDILDKVDKNVEALKTKKETR